MLLEELLTGDAIRAAKQREGPAYDVRRDVAPDLGVIVGQSFLRDALVRPVEAVGMGELDRAPLGHRRLGRRFRHLPPDLASGFVFAKPAE